MLLASCGKNPIGSKVDRQAKLVFVKTDTLERRGIYTMNIDGSELKPIAIKGDTVDFPGWWGNRYVIGETPTPWVINHPRWSPDGNKIVCQLTWAAEGYVIMIMNADGSDKHVLWKVRSATLWPRWSPEGDKILFLRSGGLGAVLGIGIVDSSGENDRDFVINGGEPPHTPVIFESDTIWFYSYAGHDFQWGPTGSQIYGTGRVNEKPDPSQPLPRSPATEIFSFDTNTGNILERLTYNQVYEDLFQLSPDGQNVAFRRGKYTEPKPNSFFVLSLTDGTLMEISVDNTINGFWNWSNDSQNIVFAKNENPDKYRKDFYLYMVNIQQQNEITKLTPFRATEPDLFIPKQ